MLRTISITILSLLFSFTAENAIAETNTKTGSKTFINTIIDVSEGLTLAQINEQGRLNTLAVIEDNDRIIKAINLSKLTDITGGIVETYQKLGYKEIVGVIDSNKDVSLEQYPYEQLVSPAGSGLHHIALGFNYADHADEIEQEHQPFVFLKATQPTREQSIETDGSTLLDYEVEICARPLTSIEESNHGGADGDGLEIGFFLCGDFTDRASLMRNINLDNMRSGRGFSDAKSRKNYFPTGPYMVVPKDTKGFLNKVSFSLYRNGGLKQKSSTSEMIWSLDAIIREIFNNHKNRKPTYSSRINNWLIDNKVTTDMVISTGTPEGVIMKPPTVTFKATKGIMYLLTGSFLNTDLRSYVIDRYIQAKLDEGEFLQPGERVELKSSFLGEMRLDIVSGSSDNP